MTEASQSKTVLIAEDSRFYRSMLSYALDEDGCRVLVASGGEEALAILGRELPDVHLLITDLGMPGMNGFELIEKVRRTGGGEKLPILVVTQYVLNTVEREILRQHNVIAILTKATSVERILYEVRDALHPEDKERRRSARAPLVLPVTVRGPKDTWVTNTFNVSETGMFLVLGDQEPPTAGTDVAIKFWVPDQDNIFQVPAQVMWVNSDGPTMRRSHPPGFGVHYVNPDERTLIAVRRFLRANA